MWSLAGQQCSQVVAAQGGFGLAAMIRKSLPLTRCATFRNTI